MGLSDTELGFWDRDGVMARTGSSWSADVCHPIHATRVLCEVAVERGVPAAHVLAGTGVTPADLSMIPMA